MHLDVFLKETPLLSNILYIRLLIALKFFNNFKIIFKLDFFFDLNTCNLKSKT